MAARLSLEQYQQLAALTGIKPTAAIHQALQLIYVDGLSPADAARQVGITKGAVSTAQSRVEARIADARALLDLCTRVGLLPQK